MLCSRAFISERQDDSPALVPLVAFSINDSAPPLGTGYTPFYADRGQHLRRPLSTPVDPFASPPSNGSAVAQLIDNVTGEVRALLQEYKDRRKAALDQRRRAVYFEVTVED